MVEDRLVRGIHPMVGRRLNLWRLRQFDVVRLEAPEDVLLYHCTAPDNPADQRLVALAQVRQVAVVRDESGAVVALPHAERAVENCLEAIRRARTERPDGAKLDLNQVWVHVWPVVDADVEQLSTLRDKITPLTEGASIEEVQAHGRVPGPDGTPQPIVVRFQARVGGGAATTIDVPPTEPLQPLDDYASKVLRAKRRGLVYPYELETLLSGPGGTVVEHDLDDTGALVPVDRPAGSTRRRCWSRSSPRRPTCTPRASPAWCCAATPPRPWEPSPSRSAPGSSRRSTSPSGCRCRSSGSRCRPAPGSPWTPAPRTWTGSRPRSSGSWSSPRTAARSTSWWPASTSARSPTGTPRRRCSCTRAASS